MKLKLKKIALPLYVIFFCMFLYLPIIILTTYSFNQGGFPAQWAGLSFCWYHELFASVEIWRAFENSIAVALSSAFLSVTFGLMFVCGAKHIRKNISYFFYSNILLPDIVIAVGILSLFSYFMIPLGLITLIVGHTLLGLGFTVPILKARLDELDARLIEASLDLGASSLYTFRYIVLPFLYPAILVSTLLVMIVSFDDFVISFFCAGSSAQTLSLYVFTMIRSGISPTVNALSTIMLFVSSFFILAISLLQTRLGVSGEK
ncbi:ABC transporter permease [Candidatus Babeliales bacterium]|nr:ABC transporter permease [Candidatus Babeliales bacterium]MBP9843818.1 ABC transporter permease [Candidatus Babeliales bacterium]